MPPRKKPDRDERIDRIVEHVNGDDYAMSELEREEVDRLTDDQIDQLEQAFGLT